MTSYRNIFRLMFVIFFLHLMGDVFYRWDGFKYYASFSDYLPSMAWISVLWTIVAAFAATAVWLFLKIFEWVLLRIRWKIRIELYITFITIFVFLAVIVWYFKIQLFLHGTTAHEKSIIAICLSIIALLLTWLFRNKAEGIIKVLRIQERISPLVWLYSIWLIFSALLVSYCLLVKQPASTVPQETSQSSLMTGKRLWTHQTYVNAEGATAPLKSSTENLPLILRNNGYYTMAFIANNMASPRLLGIKESFDLAPRTMEFTTPASLSETINVFLYKHFANKFRLYNWIMKADFPFLYFLSQISKEATKTEVPPEIAFNMFLSSVDDNPSVPFFAWIHVLPPHTPYSPPEPYLGMFDTSDNLKRSQASEIQLWRDWNFIRTRYDEFIRYCDKQLETFIEMLTAREKLKNTIIILSSDHGESFEHGYLGHGDQYLYEQVTHVPLIIKEPDQHNGRIIHDLVEQIDIPATILDLALIPVPEWMEGRSLVPLMRGKILPSRTAFSMAIAGNPRGKEISRGTIAVWQDDYKLIYDLDKHESLLFNLKSDPDELENISLKEKDMGQQLLSLIQSNLERANRNILAGESLLR
ncbi:MAG: sulfatase-like hydrolase/transferase [Nitrospirae bacterium]|nr:sulfatase-like hydrolase/transferase [Nitrospirota bacterium]